MWGIFKKTVKSGRAECDPGAVSTRLAILRYHLDFADHLLRGGSQDSYRRGHCHVVPSSDYWGRPMAFEGATHARAACEHVAVEAHEMCADADVFELTPVYC